MRRKVNLVGQSTLTVSLPNKWVKAVGLNKGDEVDVVQTGNNLVIGKEAKREFSTITLRLKGKGPLRTVTGVLYRAGYDEMIIYLEEKISLAELNKILNFFVGLEIKEFSESRVVLRVITPVSFKDYNFFINKMFITNQAMISELINFFDKGEFSMENVEEMRKTNLKSREYCMRTINKLGPEGRTEELYSFLLLLEKISGSLWYTGQYISSNKVKKSKKIIELLEKLKELIKKFHHVYTKKDYEKGINDVLSDRYVVIKEWFNDNKLINIYKQKDIDPIVVAMILNIRMHISSAMSRFLTTIMEFK